MSVEPPVLEQPPSTMQMIPPSGDELVEDALVPSEAKRRFSPIDVIGPLVVLGVFVGVWNFMHYWGLEHIFHKGNFLLPPWRNILYDSFVRTIPQPDGSTVTPRNNMFQALWVTTRLMLVGFGISILIGMALAFVMTPARWLERSLWPYLVALQAVPILVISPVLGSIFGYKENTRVIVCVIISIVPIVSNTLFGLRSVERGQHDLFTLQGVSSWTRLTKLQFPAALPAIFTGLRISAGLAVIGMVVGELFNRQGAKGIGILMDEYRSRNQFTYTWGALLLSSLLGIAVFFLFGWLQKAVIGRWHESTTGA
jgi:NitT/TauT family transport system permease protein